MLGERHGQDATKQLFVPEGCSVVEILVWGLGEGLFEFTWRGQVELAAVLNSLVYLLLQ